MNEHYLTERQQKILRFLIEEYVDASRAVGSRTLAENYPLNVSSATVRNEMSSLEKLGYIEHPHTSSGSIPTDHAYRFYVEQFTSGKRLPSSDQMMIRHQFRQVESQLESWLQLAASVLAEISGNLSLVTSPRNRVSKLRHFELLSLQDRIALLILVTQDSSVTQAMIHLDEPIQQSVLSESAGRLNELLVGKTATEILAESKKLKGFDQLVSQHLVTTLEANESGERTEVRHEGMEYIVRQPEFSSGSNELAQIFGLTRGGALLSMLLPQLSDQQGVQIFIGEENDAVMLHPFGIVVASYGVQEEVTGLLGIVGPRRMEYERSISSVSYMATLMSDLMSDLYYRE